MTRCQQNQGKIPPVGAVSPALGFPSARVSRTRLAPRCCCIYNNLMRITFDPVERDKTLAERGLDFADADMVSAGVILEVEDLRENYGEPRIIGYGL